MPWILEILATTSTTEFKGRNLTPQGSSRITNKYDSAEKPSRLFAFFGFRPLADEPEFVAGIDFPLHHLPWFDIDGRSERQGQVDIALGDPFFASDGLNLSEVVHKYESSLLNRR